MTSFYATYSSSCSLFASTFEIDRMLVNLQSLLGKRLVLNHCFIKIIITLISFIPRQDVVQKTKKSLRSIRSQVKGCTVHVTNSLTKGTIQHRSFLPFRIMRNHLGCSRDVTLRPSTKLTNCGTRLNSPLLL